MQKVRKTIPLRWGRRRSLQQLQDAQFGCAALKLFVFVALLYRPEFDVTKRLFRQICFNGQEPQHRQDSTYVRIRSGVV
jgi:hypothetical protein